MKAQKIGLVLLMSLGFVAVQAQQIQHVNKNASTQAKTSSNGVVGHQTTINKTPKVQATPSSEQRVARGVSSKTGAVKVSSVKAPNGLVASSPHVTAQHAVSGSGAVKEVPVKKLQK
jgi:hypothetical protein